MATEYQEIRDQDGLGKVRNWDGKEAWLVTRYDDVQAVLGDEGFSSDNQQPGYPATTPFFGAAQEDPLFFNLDNPQHDHFKRMFASEFTPKAVERLRPRAEEIIEDVLDGVMAGGGPTDYVEKVAVAVPLRIICEVLGIPEQDGSLFDDHTRTIMSFTSTPEEVSSAVTGLNEYFLALIEEKKARPANDMVSRMVQQHVLTGALTETQLTRNCQLLISAGHETTATMIAMGTFALLHHPEQKALFLEGDDRFCTTAVEELLRYLTVPNGGRRRVAKRDIEVAGQLINAGDGVIVATDSANYDERAFENADDLDLTRRPRHLAFGWGIHQCIGQNLSRMELKATYSAVFRRMPTLEIAVPIETLQFNNASVAYGPVSMPVKW